MSNPVAEFEVDETVEKCEARVLESLKDTYGSPCGGSIRWEANQLDDSHWANMGECENCGALYTTKV